jgi:hypothetical protein
MESFGGGNESQEALTLVLRAYNDNEHNVVLRALLDFPSMP